MPGLSFAVLAGEPHYPNLISEAKSVKEEFEARHPHTSSVRIGHYEFLLPCSVEAVAERTSEQITLTRHLELTLNSLLLESLIYQNYIQDCVEEKVTDLNFDRVRVRELDYDVLVQSISEHFDVDAEAFRLTSSERVEQLTFSSKFTDSDVNRLVPRIRHSVHTGRVLEIDRLQANLGVFAKHPEIRIYVFPIRSSFKNIPGKNDFLVVSSRDCDALGTISIRGIDRCVDDFLYTKTRIGQQNCLLWQTKQLTQLVELHDVGSIDHDDIFNRYLIRLGQFILHSTQGHSFSYLEYDAKTKCLVRSVFLSEAANEDASIECMSIGLDPVPIKNTSENLSVYIFRNWDKHTERYVYIPNIRDKDTWPDVELTRISCERNKRIEDRSFKGSKTVSEVAMVLQDQEMPMGVVCIESPHIDGLNSDLLFLRQVINNAAVFWSFLFRMSDQMWLRRNLQLQDISHNLSKLAMSLEDGAAKDELSEISLRLEEGVTFQSTKENSFEDRLNNMLWREAGRSDFLYEEIVEIVKFFSPDRHIVPVMIQSAGIQIVRDLLRNRRHSTATHEISMTTRDEYGGAKNVLVIRTALEMQLTESELRDAFRRPIRRAYRDHVGLYMMGVVARTWGGRLDFDRSPGATKRRLEICIPFGSNEEPHHASS